ncbi:unnamed protein product [marine sediment metagenome]|uniref:Uncharacterized protein n=1 Tax=marine sediment metagenome TaxID=412755 RepID=X0UCA0_9ZZZZ
MRENLTGPRIEIIWGVHHPAVQDREAVPGGELTMQTFGILTSIRRLRIPVRELTPGCLPDRNPDRHG